MTHPMCGVIRYKLVTVDGSISLSATFFCVTTTAQSFPLSPSDVIALWFMALNAYSVQRRQLNDGIGGMATRFHNTYPLDIDVLPVRI